MQIRVVCIFHRICSKLLVTKNKNDFSIFVDRKRWNTRNIAGHELKGRESFQQIVTLSSETAQRLKHFLNDLQHEKMTLEPGDQGGRHRREFFVGTKSLNVSSTWTSRTSCSPPNFSKTKSLRGHVISWLRTLIKWSESQVCHGVCVCHLRWKRLNLFGEILCIYLCSCAQRMNGPR